MCAGRCREPRCIRSPCRGSQRLHRALGGTRILLAAAPTAPPCFCRWQRSSLLHRGFPPPDYSAGRCCSNPPLQPLFKADKTETPVPGSDTGVLGGRGWIAQAAHLKKPRRGFFTRRTIRRVDAVRIHPCSPFCKADKTETPVPGSDTGVLGGRVWIARAALLKTAHWAVFALSSATAPQLFESTRSMSLALSQNKNLSALAYAEAFWWSEAT